ncbi:MAG: ABC transporter ATP-binding protein [Candidatus Bathyarchaeia archaeon]
MSNVVIETINLIKRYPTSLKNISSRHPWTAWQVGGLKEILTRRRNFIQALNGVDLKVYRGEVFGLLGPNGAGKTTLIKILCTLVLPDGGEAYVNGYDVVRESSKVLRNLQAVLGDPRGFDWRLTARENLEFYATLYGLQKDYARKRIEDLLDLMGLSERADDMYQRFSTGMARKLQLCRALLLDTPILLFDEPTAGLDPISAVEFRHLLRDKLAKSERRTVFIATHNMWEAQTICDRVAIINRGKIIACDKPENLGRYVNPVKRYTFVIEVNDASWSKVRDFISESSRLNGIINLRLDKNNSVAKVILTINKDFGISEVLKFAVKHNLRIRDIELHEPSLEEIFITLVRGEKN